MYYDYFSDRLRAARNRVAAATTESERLRLIDVARLYEELIHAIPAHRAGIAPSCFVRIGQDDSDRARQAG